MKSPFLFKIAAPEVFFYEAVKDDEEIAATHFFYFEVGGAVLAVLPGVGHYRKS